MKIKNSLLLLTAFSLVISLSSCNPDKNNSASSSDKPSASSTIDSSIDDEPSSKPQDSVSSVSSESSSSHQDSVSSTSSESSSDSQDSVSSVSSSEQETQTFTVTWKNYNGEILEIDYKVAYGAMPSYDYETPTRPSDDTYDYVFIGWTPAITPVTSNQTYTATYNQVEKN